MPEVALGPEEVVAARTALLAEYTAAVEKKKSILDELKAGEAALSTPIREKWAGKREELARLDLPKHRMDALLKKNARSEARELADAKKAAGIPDRREEMRREVPYDTWFDFLCWKVSQGNETAPAVLMSGKTLAEKDLFAEYTAASKKRKAVLDELKAGEAALSAPIREKWTSKREELARVNLPKRHIYALLRKSGQNEKLEIAAAKEAAGIPGRREEIRREIPYTSWIDFLRRKASEGNETALAVLRSKKVPVEEELPTQSDYERRREIWDKWRQKRNEYSGTHKYGVYRKGLLALTRAWELAELETLEPDKPRLFTGFTSSIDAWGTVMITLAGGGRIRDSGKEILFSAHDAAAKEAALKYAQAKWGNALLAGNRLRPDDSARIRPVGENTQKAHSDKDKNAEHSDKDAGR
jgi:hypothetical protein